jgi:putative redox protein
MTSKITYLGDLRTECTHIRSGQTWITDAPPDNQGKGEAFSPTDLTATSLGACMATIMGISAREHNLDIAGMHIEITKLMAVGPRRIAGIDVDVFMPKHMIESRSRKILEAAGRSCPVALSLHPDLVQNIVFHW